MLLGPLLPNPQGVTTFVSTVDAGATAVPDQTSEFSAVWLLDEATDTNRTAEVCASGTPSDCDLNEKSGIDVGQDTSNKQEGVASASFDAAANEDMRCDFSGGACDSLRTVAGGTAISWGAWFRPTGTCAGPGTGQGICYVMTAFDFAGDGFDMGRDSGGTPSDGGFRCSIDNTDAQSWGDTGLEADTWYHGVCTYGAVASDDVLVYVNGLDDDADTPGNQAVRATVDNQNSLFISGNTSSQDFNGNIDEVFIIDQELTAAEQCHICSCGISNFRNCTYSGASYVDEGVNASLCNSCTLPADPSNPIQ